MGVEVYTKEVVVKSNDYGITLGNSMDRIEIQENFSWIEVYGRVAEHVDVKKMRTNGKLVFRYENFAT